MTFSTFKAAIALANERGEIISIGGGEPTFHPKFLEFLGYAIVHYNGESECPIWMATNGKLTHIADILANLTEKKVISVELSQDAYHEDIDPRVVRRFEKLHCIRNTTKNQHPIGAGRALKNFGDNCYTGICICGELFIRPSGDIHYCGCADSPKLGSVNGEYDIPSDKDEHKCFRRSNSI
jgi:hypothetical protein